jgi:undecaprenyl-diphosphatase
VAHPVFKTGRAEQPSAWKVRFLRRSVKAALAKVGPIGWDFSLYDALNDFVARHDALEDALHFFAVDAQILFVALLAVLFFARGKHASRNGRHGVVAAAFSATLALGVAQVIGAVWDRARPYEAHPGDAHLFLTRSPDPSFPSDHATAAFAIAVAIGLRHRGAGVLAFALAVIVSIARIALGTHYPTDVVAGALLGTTAALVFWIPPVRRPLSRLADWCGALYDRAVVSARGASPRAAR